MGNVNPSRHGGCPHHPRSRFNVKIFVAGATGRTGQWIVKELVAKNMAVVALVRDRQKAQELLPDTVEILVGDLQQPHTYQRALQGCDGIICAAAGTPSFTFPALLNNFSVFYQVDFVATKKLIDLAIAAHIPQFVLLSSLCTSRFFHFLNLFGLVLHWKHQTEKYLKASGLAYTIVRPGGLIDEDSEDGIVMAGEDTLFEGRISRRKVAQTCVASLEYAIAKNQVLEIIATADTPAQPWETLIAAVEN